MTVSQTQPDGLPDPDIPVMFTGLPRSGTTWLGQLAQRYLDVSALDEGTFMLWLARQKHREKSWRDPHELKRFLRLFVASRYYFTLLYNQQPDEEAIVNRLVELVTFPTVQAIGRAVFILTREKLGLPRLGHESPAMMWDPHAVLTVFPHSRWVHILRDPRDAATSVLKQPWGANNVYVSAKRWNHQVRRMRRIGRDLGTGRYTEFRYEDLLQEPEATMRSLMAFVCGTVSEEKLRAFLAESRENPRRANYGNWRKELSPRQIRLIEGAAREEMRRTGYRPVTGATGVSVPQAAYWTFHNRFVQLCRIVSGRLDTTGGAKRLVRRPVTRGD